MSLTIYDINLILVFICYDERDGRVDQGIPTVRASVSTELCSFLMSDPFLRSFKVAKHSKSNLADVALAGLASKENFRKINLRSVKSTDVVTNNSTLPFNKLMLIRIKGQKLKKVNCVFCKHVLNGGVRYLLVLSLNDVQLINHNKRMLNTRSVMYVSDLNC